MLITLTKDTKMDNQITEIEQIIAKEITVDSEGRGYISGRGLARLLGVSTTRFTAARMASRIAETITSQGLDPAALASEGYPDTVLVEIAYYYAVDAQNTSEQAKQVLKVLGAIGARTWMQKVKGWTTKPVQPTLPPGDVRVTNLMEACKFFHIDTNNARFQQALSDLAGDILGLTPDQPLLEGEEDRWCGVAERAEELGYSPKLVTGKRSLLGKWVKKHYPGEPRQEKRLCNGTQRVVNLYLVGPDLDSCIEEYFKGHLKH